jgi:hypothetical protein
MLAKDKPFEHQNKNLWNPPSYLKYRQFVVVIKQNFKILVRQNSILMINLKKLSLLFFGVFAFCVKQSYQIPMDSDAEFVKIQALDNHVYLIEDYNYWKTNSLFYISNTNVYFFSSGWSNKSAEQILWKAKTLTFLPFTGLFLIAPDLDFSGGIQQFAEEQVPIYIQKDGYKVLTLNWIKWQTEMKKKFISWKYTESIPTITGVIESKLELENQNILLFYPDKIVSEGNLILYLKNEQILYAGNILNHPNEYILNLNENQKKSLLELIKKLNNLPIRYIITGKGSPIYNKNLLNTIYNFYNKY